MKLYAISDLHLDHEANRLALAALPAQPEDWLIVAGDVSSSTAHIERGLGELRRRFARVLWVPGNHDLWSVPDDPCPLVGVARYERLVEICRRLDVLTPEDPYPLWSGAGGPCRIAPLFVLYDYSFRPAEVPFERAIDWAVESGVLCADERYLVPTPHPTRQAWCEDRLRRTFPRLEAAAAEGPLVLVNHFPLRRDLAVLPRIPRFTIWCGTTRTEDWHVRFRARVVVSGHIHIRRTDWRDGVRFEEVSLGYPSQWRSDRGVRGYLREILPGPS